jgi:heterodisulfide reductase subunit C
MKQNVLTSAAQDAHAVISSIEQESGVSVKDCYQCGKCAAGCPVSAQADMTCRQVIRNLQLGLIDDVLSSNMPWLCVGCGVCLARCPQDVDLPSLNEAICRYEMRLGRPAVREGERFMNIFLDNVQAKGVSDETILAARFNLETGHFMQDVMSAPKMMQLGMLNPTDSFKPHKDEEVERIVRKCRAAEAEKAEEVRAPERAKRAAEREKAVDAASSQAKDAAMSAASAAATAVDQASGAVTQILNDAKTQWGGGRR